MNTLGKSSNDYTYFSIIIDKPFDNLYKVFNTYSVGWSLLKYEQLLEAQEDGVDIVNFDLKDNIVNKLQILYINDNEYIVIDNNANLHSYTIEKIKEQQDNFIFYRKNLVNTPTMPPEIDLLYKTQKFNAKASLLGLARISTGAMEEGVLENTSYKYVLEDIIDKQGETLYIPGFIDTINGLAISKVHFTNIEICEGVKSIKTRAFYKSTIVNPIEFPKSLTYLSINAFDKCKIHIKNLEKIGN